MGKKKILIVEDESPLRDALATKFSKEGLRVLEARDGCEGLTIALKKKPDIILLDIVMPKMDGLTMLKKLRQDTKGMLIPVIMLTNLAEAQDEVSSLAANVVDYFVKSEWRLEDLVNRVSKHLYVDPY